MDSRWSSNKTKNQEPKNTHRTAKNNSEATYDGIISAVKFIAPRVDNVEIIDSEDMTFSIRIYGKIKNKMVVKHIFIVN